MESSLEKIVAQQTRGVTTPLGGDNFKKFSVNLKKFFMKKNSEMSDVLTLMRTVFNVNYFFNLQDVQFMYDELSNKGTQESYSTSWNGVYLIGAFFTQNSYGENTLTHFFLRKFEGFKGPLDAWKQDVSFPRGVRHYSIFAVLPTGFQLSAEERKDFHNSSVTQYREEDLLDLGISCKRIVNLMQSYETEETKIT